MNEKGEITLVIDGSESIQNILSIIKTFLTVGKMGFSRRLDEVEVEVTPGWENVTVLLNGKIPELCVYANAKEGYVTCLKCDKNDELIIQDGKPVCEKIFGDVLIEFEGIGKGLGRLNDNCFIIEHKDDTRERV